MRTFEELADLSGRAALVVGGAGHIGRAVCRTLGALGAEVLSGDVTDQDPLPGVPSLQVDLHDEEATRLLIPAALDILGRLDVLVHCAAYTGDTVVKGWVAPFEEQTVDPWDRAYRVNVTSAMILTQAARPVLASTGRGSIVFVSSIYAFLAPDPRVYEGTRMHSPAGYSASKGALLQLMRHLAPLMAPEVRVNAVSPGGIARGQDRRFVQRYEEGTPLARMGTEEDVIGAIAYLASDLSSYVTGANLVVDGGRSIW